MANYGAKILDIAARSLSAQQAIIANISNNIANVNTPGYSRRVVTLQTAESGRSGTGVDVGNGVEVADIRRMADEYLTQVFREAAGKHSSSQLQNDLLSRVDQLFKLDGTAPTISNDLNAFFGAINDLTTNPSSIELRKVVIERAQSLVTSISGTFNAIASIQDEANNRVTNEVAAVNTLTAQIAQLNTEVSKVEQGGSATASDARDKRDELLKQLAEKLSFQTVEQTDGQVSIYLSNGFTIVSGAHNYNLSVTTTPSFATGSVPNSLSGKILSYITYDYSGGGGTGDFDLTQVIQDGEGSLGGLLQLRGYVDPNYSGTDPTFQANGTLVEVASRVEALARDLLVRFNDTYLGPDKNTSTVGRQPSALDLYGNTPDYNSDPFGFFTFAYNGTRDDDGDGFPSGTDLAALNVASFASVLQLRSTDPKRIAAALDQSSNGSLTLVTGDGSNATLLAALQSASSTFSAGGFSLTGTFDDVYNETITHVGGAKSAMENRASLDTANLATAQSQRDQVAAPSLDEEFSKLIVFQKAYQASAKMVKTAEEMLAIVIGLVG